MQNTIILLEVRQTVDMEVELLEEMERHHIADIMEEMEAHKLQEVQKLGGQELVNKEA